MIYLHKYQRYTLDIKYKTAYTKVGFSGVCMRTLFSFIISAVIAVLVSGIITPYQAEAATKLLTINPPTGGVITVSGAGLSLSCDSTGTSCSGQATVGQTATITAAADSGYKFVNWSVVVGTGTPQTVTGATYTTLMPNNTVTVTANFQALYTLSASISGVNGGGGEISSSLAGTQGWTISCNSDPKFSLNCSATYANGTAVILTATPWSSSVFSGWSNCNGPNGNLCTAIVDTNKTVSATFTANTLTVNKSGAGSGTVTSSPGTINCGSTCSNTFNVGSSITLTAAPAAGSGFSGWSGACTGIDLTCTFTLSTPSSVTANFTPLYNLHTSAVSINNGSGSISSSPAGSPSAISCGTSIFNGFICDSGYLPNTVVTLTATPDTNTVFSGWSNCSAPSGNQCTVTMDAAKNVGATFTANTLSISKSGSGSGTVSSVPAAIDCGATCSGSFNAGATVQLTAAADKFSAFTGWSGACSGTSPICQVAMNAPTGATANFTRYYQLTVSSAGTGSGTVTSSPGAISCGATCSDSYLDGSTVLLSAVPAAGSYFSGWSGACIGASPVCRVTLTAATDVTASFSPTKVPLTISPSGSGTGTVTSLPPGINCGSTCTANFDGSSMVTLTAQPAAGSVVSWSGVCSGTDPTCIVTMDTAKNVAVNFVAFDQSSIDFTWTAAPFSSHYKENTNVPFSSGGCLNASGSSLSQVGGIPVARLFWEWSGMQRRNGTLTTFVSPESSKSCPNDIEDGVYSVTLKLFDANGILLGKKMKPVIVRNVTMAAIGDSFSSGEGNPDVRMSYPNWPEKVATNDSTKDPYFGSPLWADSGDVEKSFPLSIHWASDLFFVPPAEWPDHRVHSRCHRSSSSASSVAATALATEHPELAVTFIHRSCSGGTIEGEVNENYMGVEKDFGTLAPIRQITLLDDTLTKAKKSADILTISMGGNDIGFADIVTQLLLLPHAQTIFDLETDLSNKITSLNYPAPPETSALYTRFDTKLSERASLLGATKFITEYPDLITTVAPSSPPVLPVTIDDMPINSLRDVRFDPILGKISSTVLHTLFANWFPGYEGQLMANVVESSVFDGITSDEAIWAYTKALIPLNEAVSTAAGRFGWNLVDGIQAGFRGHGYCSTKDYGCDPDQTWIRSGELSAQYQGPTTISYDNGKDCFDCKANTKGVMHPNERGHKFIGDAIKAKIDQTMFADLEITPVTPPTSVTLGSTYAYSFSVVNHGPGDAKSIQIAVNASGVVTPAITSCGVVPLTDPAATCSTAGYATIPQLKANAPPATVTFYLTLPADAMQTKSVVSGTPLTVRGYVNAVSTFDSAPLNNVSDAVALIAGDNVLPTIQCPSNFTVTGSAAPFDFYTPAEPKASAHWGLISDNFAGVKAVCDHTSPVTSLVSAAVPVICSAVDLTGNSSATCTFTVTFNDTATSSTTTTLPAGVSNLQLTGSGDINGTGNSLDNFITGNSGNNYIDGGAGNDTAVFCGKMSEYTVDRVNGAIVVSHVHPVNGSGCSDGTDTLVNIEELQFADGILSISYSREELINSTTAYKQLDSSNSALTDGGHVIVWRSLQSDGTGIINAQRYDAAGQMIGNEFKVNASGSTDQSVPAVAGLKDGSFVVVWNSKNVAGWVVIGQRFDSSGNKVGAEFAVDNSASIAANKNPSITPLKNGGFAAGWSNGGNVFTRTFDASFSAVTASPLQINSSTGTNSSISLSSLANGGYVAAWLNGGIIGRLFDASGTATSAELQLSDTSVTNFSSLNSYVQIGLNSVNASKIQVSVAGLTGGGFVTAWNTNGTSTDIALRRFSDSGTAIGASTIANTTTADLQWGPTIAALMDGGYVVSWTSATTTDLANVTSGVYAQRYNQTGLAVGGEFLVNTPNTGLKLNSAIAALKTGGFVVTSTKLIPTSAPDSIASGSDIYQMMFDIDSQSLWRLTRHIYISTQGSNLLDALLSTSYWPGGSTPRAMIGQGGGDVFQIGNPGSIAMEFVPENSPAQNLDCLPRFCVNITRVFPSLGSTDTVMSSVSYTLLKNIENLTLTGAANINGTGNDQDNTLQGNSGNNILDGGAGNDTVLFTGPARNYVVTPVSLGVITVQDTTGIDGTDTLIDIEKIRFSTGSFALSWETVNNAPVLSITAIGGGLEFPVAASGVVLNGGSGNNSFTIGSAGASTILTGSGNGTDTVSASISYTLPANVENLILTGSANISGTGNTLNNTISGNSGNNVLDGGTGVDTAVFTGNMADYTITRDASGHVIVQDLRQGSPDGTDTLINFERLKFADGAMSIGGDTQVNTFVPGIQSSPAIAVNAGEYLITWSSQEQDSNGFGIYGQRFTTSGIPVGNEFRINTTTAGDQFNPSVVSLGADGYSVVWTSQTASGGFNVMGQRLSNAGQPIGGEFQVNAAEAVGITPPKAAPITGGYAVAWGTQQNSGSVALLARRFDQSAALGSEFQVNTTSGAGIGTAAIAGLSSGDFVVTWPMVLSTGGTSLFVQRFNTTGMFQGIETQVNTVVENGIPNVSVAAHASGGFVVAWDSKTSILDADGGILAKRFYASGTALGNEFLVNSFTTGSQRLPSVATLTGGGFVVAWESILQDGSGSGIFAKTYDSSGVVVGSEFGAPVDTIGDQIQPAVAGISASRQIFAWSSRSSASGDWNVFQHIITDGLPEWLVIKTPATPTSVSATPGNASAVITFTAPGAASDRPISGFTVSCSPVAGGATVTAEGNGSPVTVNGMVNGVSYTCTVAASNSVGVGAISQPVTVTPTAGLPLPPQYLTAQPGDRSIILNFSAPLSNGGAAISGYSSSCTPVGGGQAIILQGPGSPAVIPGLINGTTYTCSVYAINSFGASIATTSGQVTPALPPQAPSAVSAQPGNGAASISFSAPSDGGSVITGYTVRCTNAGTTLSGAGTSSPITVGGLSNSTLYSCTVTARNAAGTGPASSAATVTPSGTYTLSVSVSGTGTGFVQNVAPASPNINCPGTCSAEYPSGGTVYLSATPAWYSTVVWGNVDGANGNSASVNLGAPRTINAVFDQKQSTKLIPSDTFHGTLQFAYNASASQSGGTIFAKNSSLVRFTEFLNLDKPYTVLINGGMDEAFNQTATPTVIQGKLTISKGRVTVKNLKIQ